MAAAKGVTQRGERAREHRLRAMVDEHFPFVWRSLRAFGVFEADVDDAAQSVFWIASQKLDAIAYGKERSFLYSTARGVAANVRRSQKRRREDFEKHDTVDFDENPERRTEQSQARRQLDEVLSEMSEDLRTTFVLFELEELTMVEIAEMFDIPVGTAASRLRRAREEFRRLVALKFGEEP